MKMVRYNEWSTNLSEELIRMKEKILMKLSSLRGGDCSNIKFGPAGSYARGEETSKSDIDIVVDTDILTLKQIDDIKNHFDIESDVIQLKLLETEDKELDKYTLEPGLPLNENSAYKTISREVIWCE